MKTKILPLIICITFTGYTINSYAQANTSLSNLTNPTSVNQTLIPASNYTYDLGTSAKGWRNGYFAGAIYLNGVRFLAFPSSGLNNTFVGANSGISNSGDFNVGVGYESLYNNSSGYFNTSVGFESLFNNTSGQNNAAFGLEALYHNTTGNNNTAIGYLSLYTNTTGYSNVAIGANALYTNSKGHNLVAVGDSALYNQAVSSSDDYKNTAVGSKTLYANTTGNQNTATGYRALYSNADGANNTATGHHALYFNVFGANNTASGVGALYKNLSSSNTATGYQALNQNTLGYNNTATGYAALFSNVDGYLNTATGNYALYENTSGNYNTAVGDDAGVQLTTGWYNTFIGYYASPDVGQNPNNSTAIGANAMVNGYNATAIGFLSYAATNQVRIGDNGVTSIGGYTNWSNVSDGRIKKNIKSNVPGLEFINKLKPITYNLDLDAADKIIHKPALKDKNGNAIQRTQDELAARKEKEQIAYSGFIAQDVEKAAKGLNYDFSGVDAAKNEHDLYGLRYAEFVVPLVKAVQELSSENEKLKSENEDLEKKYDAQQKQIDELKAMVFTGNKFTAATANDQQQTINLSSASLEQNNPNPFDHTTTIHYTLPQKFSSAQIVVTDNNGKTLKQINISKAGKGVVNVDASTLASGTYNYSLIVDGKLIVTKQMILLQ